MWWLLDDYKKGTYNTRTLKGKQEPKYHKNKITLCQCVSLENDKRELLL